MSLGSFCLVLHGHLPWVLHHGRWPHGEDWLYEAASETWMPMLEVLDRLAADGIHPGWTLGLTPILLEQLGHTRFQEGFVAYLDEQVERARRDEAEFRGRGDEHLAWLATEHEQRYTAMKAHFEAIGGQIARAFGEHARSWRIEILSSNATHGYHPLILHDACARAQIRTGLATTERHLGWRPPGVWLPECAYRPPGPWVPPVLHGDTRDRRGVASLFADEGVEFFFVDTHLIVDSRSEAVIDGSEVRPVGWDQAQWDRSRAWRSPLEPHRVCEGGALTGLSVLARHPGVSEQVWSGDVGYPGDGTFREFHKRHGMRGLHYWKITGNKVDLGGKHPYYPDDCEHVLHRQAEHFAQIVVEQLRAHHHETGRQGIVCAPFDAELFGHWWYEGPRFLEKVARALHANPEVDVGTVSASLAKIPPDKGVALPEGSWGAGGNHDVWLNDELTFYWEIAYRAEDRFTSLLDRANWRENADIRTYLTEAGRQLLLLQASDWPFVITTRGAVDYGMRRILDHAARFDDLANAVEDLIENRLPGPIAENTLERCQLLDPVFPDLDLGLVVLVVAERQLRQDPITGRWVVLSTARTYPALHLRHPGGLPVGTPETCPFCPGHEAATPPTLDQNGDPWRQRAFPNKFPALAVEGELAPMANGPYVQANGIGAHEVIVETPRHKGALTVEETEGALQLVQRRMQDLFGDQRLRYTAWFRNRGFYAGASQPHPHSQLLSTPFVPPTVERIGRRMAAHLQDEGHELIDYVLAEERRDGRRLLWETDCVTVFCSYAPSVPFEVCLVPNSFAPRFRDAEPDLVHDIAEALCRVEQALNDVLGGPDFNVILYDCPEGDWPGYRWTLWVLPRLVGFAGLEMATGLSAHAMLPEDAAELLR